MYPAKVKIELMEEYSEAKTCKGKSELRNSKILTIFIHQSGNNNYFEIIASTEFVYEKPGINRHASANVTDVVDVS